jgi:hypothetical protein
MMKQQFPSFVMLALAALGSIGGLGWSLYSGGYVVAVGVVGLSFMAWPKIVEHWNNVFGKG